MEGGSVLEVGGEVLELLLPVSVCMFLLVFLVTTLTPGGSSLPIQSVATLMYAEEPSDSNSLKFEGALLNSLVFVAIITALTFLLLLLYYCRCVGFLKWYMSASAALVLAYMGGTVYVQLIRTWSIPLDILSFSLLLLNFTVVGVLAVFLRGLPILFTQFYLVIIGVLVAFWFTMLPEWTTWVLLVAMAAYDLVAVLAPGGPLNLLVHLAMARDEQIPALIYEGRPATTNHRSGRWRRPLNSAINAPSTELQPHSRPQIAGDDRANLQTMRSNNTSAHEESTRSSATEDEESLPLINRPSSSQTVVTMPEGQVSVEVRELQAEEEDENGIGLSASGAIKLGLGDFVFYSVLVGRAAMYDLMTVYACYLAIVAGLCSTLILLAIARRALPALPISVCLGVVFYFLTRLFLEPLVVFLSTNLLMF